MTRWWWLAMCNPQAPREDTPHCARLEASEPPTPGVGSGPPPVLLAAEQLVAALQQSLPMPPPPGPATTSLLLQWLTQHEHSAVQPTHLIPNNGDDDVGDDDGEVASEPKRKPSSPGKVLPTLNKRKGKDTGLVAVKSAITKLQNITKRSKASDDEYDKFGKHIAAQLRQVAITQLYNPSGEIPVSDDNREASLYGRSIPSRIWCIFSIAREQFSKCGDESSPDDESTLKYGATWSGSTSSTSDLSSSSSDEPAGTHGSAADHSTTGCNDDFQWVRSSSPVESQRDTPVKPPPKPPPIADGNKNSGDRHRVREHCCCPPPAPCYHNHCCRRSCVAWDTCCPCRPQCRWDYPTPHYKSPGDVEERVHRLEADKDSLQLQVTVLSEQIEVQTEKIVDLEKMLEEKKRQLSSTESLLQTEMLARSSLETQKLELLSAISELKLQHAALERDNLELRERLSEERRRNKPPVVPRAGMHATSTPFTSPVQGSQLLVGASPSPSPVSSMSDGSPRRMVTEDFKDIPPPRTPPANYRRKVDHYGSLPRQRAGSGSSMQPFDGGPGGAKKGVVFAETERVVIDDAPVEDEEEEDVAATSLSPQHSPSLQLQKNKGIKKIFGRMKRSGSGNLDDLLGEGDFRRGGVRATASARLGWGSTPAPTPKPEIPFAQWDSDAISQWLQDLGLECYAGDARRWVKSGAQLLTATPQELEKEMGIKSPLHRKKLQLALLCESGGPGRDLDMHLEVAGRLDAGWVLRWLDDVGLPQHKEAFLAARVDGRVLHRLTTEDLALLHVSSSLHVASLRRGIQVLRDNNFEPGCLQRRSLPEEAGPPTPQEVALWTNHRVMEWLRVVDLAEYAPNLRGSGVHGGLMVHEPRFTAELLASLLSIPPSKTLLRRHLNTHFKELLGRDCIQEKREAEATLGYVPLSATTKLKLTKKSQFTLKRKKSKSEMDLGDLVCPLDPSKPGEGLSLHLHGDGTSSLSKAPKAGAVSQETDSCSVESPLPERTSNV